MTRRLILAALILMAISPANDSEAAARRERADQLHADGNYAEALEVYRKAALDAATPPDKVGHHLHRTLDCLRRLNRVAQSDDFLEGVAEAHAASWQPLMAAAQGYLGTQHDGTIIAGEFERGPHRGGGEYARADERDRVRALQLYLQALPLAEREDSASKRADFYARFAGAVATQRLGHQAWRLQYLTDLSRLPDVERGWAHHGGGSPRGAPVDPDGNPVLYSVPSSFDGAANDGQRWRWLLVEAVEAEPGRRGQVSHSFAQFLRGQFGVDTLASYAWYFRAPVDEEQGSDREGSLYALHTLSDGETIARLATGIKRFELPAEFNHVLLFQQLAEEPGGSYQQSAMLQLADIYQNRRQFDRAADMWRRLLELNPGHKSYRQSLAQIVEPWGRFEPGRAQPAGKKATLQLRFRNATAMHLTAHRIDLELLLSDVKEYLEDNPRKLDWQRVDLGDIGRRLVQEDQTRYLAGKAADWTERLRPLERHFDRLIELKTPLTEAGAYLLVGKLKDGNTARIIVWLEDTAIVEKGLDKGSYFYVADASDGSPLGGAKLEFFGYRMEYLDSKLNKLLGRTHEVKTTSFTRTTDRDGQLILKDVENRHNYQWLIVARGSDGRLAFKGFQGLWTGRWYDRDYNVTKVFNITDRPVYRPGHTVKFKLWVRHAQYDKPDVSQFAGSSVRVEIYNPRGDRVLSKDYTADEYGGVSGEYTLPENAGLGVWRLQNNRGNASTFRVEEYKKPEFLVEIEAPSEPVALGDRIEATISAKYLFGAPVTEAKVTYKVLRHEHSATWYPPAPWDWFYGPGYWWFGYDYPWYPGWGYWGCWRPVPWWWSRPAPQPELVAEGEAAIGHDGTLKLPIDTLPAKLIHGDKDHRYSITAEVVDASRRTIVGTGEVLVARRPYKVYAWTQRGHYRPGDVIEAGFSARTLDGKPVAGNGKLRLLRIGYEGEEREPVETEVQSWELDTNARGEATKKLEAARPGQYRLSYTVTRGEHSIEGGYVFSVLGQTPTSGWLDRVLKRSATAADFRYSALELVPDKRKYRPGEAIELLINTDQTESTVLLFVRPTNGVYLAPKVLRLEGRSHVETIEVTKKDMPNFFVEALTLSGARVHTEAREIAVPPEKRVLDMEVLPSEEEYLPGDEATIRVKLSDETGEPFVGSVVLGVYDKAVEYISGGSNVPEIKAFYWKWRRHHNPRTMSSLERWLHNLLKKGERGMGSVGLFGDVLAEQAQPGSGAVREMKMKSAGRQRSAMALESTAAVPAPSVAGMMADAVAEGEMAPGEPRPQAAAAPAVEPTVRQEFADTAFWAATLTTNRRGETSVSFPMPENLTTWRVRAWAMGHGTRVGEASTEVLTTKNVIVRLQAPRFFVEKDEVVLSAVVHNYLESAKRTQVVLELEGNTLEPMPGVNTTSTVTIQPDGETRVDWRVKVVREGEAVVRMKALTDEESDAMQMSFPVKVHGLERQVAVSGHLREDGERLGFTLEVPAERRVDETRLEVRYSPTLAMSMVDALPYLASYPYGCTEQTLSRFLPTVITQKILLDMGLDLEDIRNKTANFNAQELGDDAERAKQWKRRGNIIGHDENGKPVWSDNPVFDEALVADMVKVGITRLANMQLSDGGWGWFSGWGERSSPHTTAYVVHGLQKALENDVPLHPNMLERGVQWLKNYQEAQVRRLKRAETKQGDWKRYADNLDAFVYMVLGDADVANQRMRDFLYRDRTRLSPYALSMYGVALAKQRQSEKLVMVKRNIEQYLVLDQENQTAYLDLPGGYWWYWYGSEYEAHAYYLKLLAVTEPRSDKAAWLVKYLLNNRKHASYWNSTRDTALVIEAFADHIRASGEGKPDMTVEVVVDGRVHKEVRIGPENLFGYDNKLVLEGDAVTTGSHRVELRRHGRGPLYANAYLTYFSLEDPIPAAGLEVKVARRYYRLKKVDKTIKVSGSRGQAVDQKVEKYEREPLQNLALLKSGELAEIELIIESKNDYEYLVFEDNKPAGFEPVDVRSGYTGNAMNAYVEFRDDRVAFFVTRLARGRHSVSYRMRAEIPGRFSALPARGYAMYAPELKGNSDEIKLRVED